MISSENLISIAVKATGTANTTVVCYPQPLEGHATFLLVIVKIFHVHGLLKFSLHTPNGAMQLRMPVFRASGDH